MWFVRGGRFPSALPPATLPAPFQGALELGHLRAEGISAFSGRVPQHIQNLPRPMQHLLRTRDSQSPTNWRPPYAQSGVLNLARLRDTPPEAQEESLRRTSDLSLSVGVGGGARFRFSPKRHGLTTRRAA